jgi:hypothetical protein
MNQDPRRTMTGTDQFDAAPARYIAWGALILLAVILSCAAILTWLDLRAEPSASVVKPRARIDFATPLQVGQPVTLVGSGFQAGERVEIFAAPGPNASFDQLMKLAETVSDGNGSFVLVNLFAPGSDAPLYLLARGSGSGFTSYTYAAGVSVGTPMEPTMPTTPIAPIAPPATAAPDSPTPMSSPAPGSAGLPDLLVGSLLISTQSPYACTQKGNEPPLGVLVEVRNNTPYPAGPFIVQVNNAQYTLDAGLEGGRQLKLWFPGYLTGLNRVTIDSARTVAEASEANNIVEMPLAVPTAPPPCPKEPPPPLPPPPLPPPPTWPLPQPSHTPQALATPDPNAVGVWYAQYYPNQDLFEPAAIRRYEPGNPFLNLDWRTASPGPGVPPNGFSAVFTRIQDFPTADNYVFDLVVDDGGRLYVDGVLLIDEWRNGPVRTVQAARGLGRGLHTIRVEYYEAGGGARVGLSWRPGYSGWRGRYYNNTDRIGQPVLIRDDADPAGGSGLFFEWGFGPPAPEVAADNFSVDWQRTVNFGAGTYIFTAEVDDGVRFFLDGVPLMDSYSVAGSRIVTATRTIAAGPHALQVQYVEYGGQARFRFGWELAAPPPTAIPSATVAPSATPLPLALTDTPAPLPLPVTATPAATPPPPPLPPTDTVTAMPILIVPTATP